MFQGAVGEQKLETGPRLIGFGPESVDTTQRKVSEPLPGQKHRPCEVVPALQLLIVYGKSDTKRAHSGTGTSRVLWNRRRF